MTQGSSNWCGEFFDDLFAEHHFVRADSDEVPETAAFLEEKLHLKKGDLIFDQCCGIGSFTIALAAKGYRVNGVDLIPSYIERARRDAAAFGDACLFEAGDAYVYTAPELCDAAINWWTSFGYTPDDAQNIRMLERVSASLKPGAWFAMDYMNAPQRLKAFANSERIISEIKKPDCTIVWESKLDAARRMIVKKWNYTGANGKKIEKQGGGAKLYSRAELEAMLQACGFEDISFYGSTSGEPMTDESLRAIILARKCAP